MGVLRFSTAYKKPLQDQSRYLILVGGGGAGKSHFAARKIVYRLITEPQEHRYLCVRKVAATLRYSVVPLIKEVLAEAGILYIHNKTDRTITFTVNGRTQTILFVGLDDPEKLKSIERITSIWIEEATEITEDDFNQLDLRLRGKTETYKQIILTLNPVLTRARWIYERFERKQDPRATVLHYNVYDNPFIDAEYRSTLESLQDDTYRKIYLHGEWAEVKGLVFQDNFRIIPAEQYPQEPDETVYGLDFGYNNPTALVRIDIKDQDIFLHEILYERHLTNSDLIRKMQELQIPYDATIYADAAEPDRIRELQDAGWDVRPADKNVREGLALLLDRRIYSKPENTNLNKEFESYKWKEKDGQTLDEPVKMNDHAVDAVRYGVYTHLKKQGGVTIWRL